MSRSIDRKVIWFSLPLFLVLAASSGGCRPTPCDDDFKEGERFQITILGQDSAYSSCQSSVPSLAAGESFTLVAGPAVMQKGSCLCDLWRLVATNKERCNEPSRINLSATDVDGESRFAPIYAIRSYCPPTDGCRRGAWRQRCNPMSGQQFVERYESSLVWRAGRDILTTF
jgi:hypothetical protein